MLGGWTNFKSIDSKADIELGKQSTPYELFIMTNYTNSGN